MTLRFNCDNLRDIYSRLAKKKNHCTCVKTPVPFKRNIGNMNRLDMTYLLSYLKL